ncbi:MULTISPECIES: hypothetical protein [Myroides]|uniref:hypothetical protein n=1 Tax=Myroides odoratus TaxID=256 RepID=UPI0024BF41D7|nr:hypothetical protein [Myroides sp. mNGS23_01]WHT39755.1 hypothetical protein QNH98_03470 [Myroides sp. mNGS23_01]
MKKVLKWTMAVMIAASLGSLLISCSKEDGSNEIDTKSIKLVKEDNLEKNWIAAHFVFDESCKGAKKLAYQLSSVHITLKDNKFTAVDKYSLGEDQGSWVLEGNLIRMSSTSLGENFQFKIKELKNNELIVEVLNHEDLKEIELVSFDK